MYSFLTYSQNAESTSAKDSKQDGANIGTSFSPHAPEVPMALHIC